MRDLISRHDAFYAVNKAFDGDTLLDELVRSIAVRAIRAVPSEEPETHEEHTETHSCVCERTETHDLISRKAAIDAVLELYASHRVSWVDAVVDMIDALPSAEPEDAVMLDKETILQAGYKNREVEFRIGGRLFRVREVAQ